MNMNNQKQQFWLSPKGLAALGLIGAASYFLFMEHREHVFQLLPYLILLACPLMHIFMHGGHSHGHAHHHGDENESFQQSSEKNQAYRDGYIEGLKVGREEHDRKEDPNKEHDNAR